MFQFKPSTLDVFSLQFAFYKQLGIVQIPKSQHEVEMLMWIASFMT